MRISIKHKALQCRPFLGYVREEEALGEGVGVWVLLGDHEDAMYACVIFLHRLFLIFLLSNAFTCSDELDCGFWKISLIATKMLLSLSFCEMWF
jgi:lipid-A-disaccharide synthase-like uncharacterized protein